MTLNPAVDLGPVAVRARLPLAGLTVVVTGVVGALSREQAQAAVRALGGVPSGSVSAKTDLVVAGVGAGVSKLGKARTLRTPVVDGVVFGGLVADPGSWDGGPLGVPQELVVVADPGRVDRPVRVHKVGKVVCFPTGVREIRLKCTSCGHAWRGTDNTRIPPCPNEDEAVVSPAGS